MLDPNTIHLLKTAAQFDVHRWSDYPEVNEVVDSLFREFLAYRASKKLRIRGYEKYYRHLKVVVIDLFAANKLGFNPYRGISLRKNDYQQNSRYRHIHLKYDYLRGVLNALENLGYVEIHKGYRNKGGNGKRSRIKATNKLIDLFLSEHFRVKPLIENLGAVAVLQRTPDDELIILRDSKGEPLDYEDNPETLEMRESLKKINERLSNSQIVLDINDDQVRELTEIYGEMERFPLDLSRTSLYRVFNDPSFKLGGRFYGGWWENLPSRFRKYIRINHKPTVELDYSGHHLRMLYSREGIDAPEDLYAIDNSPFSREHLKLAALIVINASSRTSARKALIEKKLRIDTAALLALIEEHFAPVARHFYTNAGLELQYQDSQVAERVMLRMMERGAVVLPIHDSFIVRNSYEEELWDVMLEEYEKEFGYKTFLKKDRTVLEEEYAEKEPEVIDAEIKEIGFVSDDLEKLLDSENKKWFSSTFGIKGG